MNDIEKDYRSSGMTKRGVFNRFEDWRNRGEDGVALASVVILSFVILIIAASLSMTLVQAANMTSDNKAQVITFSSAESGVDHAILAAVTNNCEVTGNDATVGFEFEVYRSASETPPTGLDDPSLQAGCPQDGDRFITVKSTGTDSRGRDTEVISTYQWTIRNLGSTEGAVVAGTGLSNISQLDVYNTDGDLLIEKGNFDCNSNSNISGDVVIMEGSLSLNNYCKVQGSIYATGNVTMSNHSHVGGSVYTLGNFDASNNSTIGGDVRAKGTIRLVNDTVVTGSATGAGTGPSTVGRATVRGNVSVAGPMTANDGATIQGSLTSSSNSDAFFYNARVNGDLLINGRFNQLQASTIGGNISSAAPGASNNIDSGIRTNGWIRVAGTINGNPQGTQGVFQNSPVSPLIPPIFEVPVQLQPDFFQWRDWNYVESDWTKAGYQIELISDCNFQDNPAARAKINDRNTPTVFDLRGCSEVKSYGVTFTPRTDVTLIFGQGMKNLQDIRINAASGTGSHEFIMMVPDAVKNGIPTCAGNADQSNSLNIHGVKMDDNISSFIYSPCMVKFGGNSNINGQIYTGVADYTAGGTTNFDYLEMFIPGFPVEDAEQAPSAFDEDATERLLPMLISRVES